MRFAFHALTFRAHLFPAFYNENDYDFFAKLKWEYSPNEMIKVTLKLVNILRELDFAIKQNYSELHEIIHPKMDNIITFMKLKSPYFNDKELKAFNFLIINIRMEHLKQNEEKNKEAISKLTEELKKFEKYSDSANLEEALNFDYEKEKKKTIFDYYIEIRPKNEIEKLRQDTENQLNLQNKIIEEMSDKLNIQNLKNAEMSDELNRQRYKLNKQEDLITELKKMVVVRDKVTAWSKCRELIKEISKKLSNLLNIPENSHMKEVIDHPDSAALLQTLNWDKNTLLGLKNMEKKINKEFHPPIVFEFNNCYDIFLQTYKDYKYVIPQITDLEQFKNGLRKLIEL